MQYFYTYLFVKRLIISPIKINSMHLSPVYKRLLLSILSFAAGPLFLYAEAFKGGLFSDAQSKVLFFFFLVGFLFFLVVVGGFLVMLVDWLLNGKTTTHGFFFKSLGGFLLYTIITFFLLVVLFLS